ncbi:phosphate signaling complex protein PhoU (plasmid) [Pediococcus parvulus]|uniref:phosphate signaling complex protein PhoU n=1 Tax=Pediococcus parvulus TaxID=54062 RepID=UPI003D0076F4
MYELFSDELKKLQGRFMEMGVNISEQIYRSTKSFIDHDEKLATKVIEEDQRTNNEEISLEKQALEIIALQQPVATDFRIIISILKASSDMERMGDHAVGISRETIRIKKDQHTKSCEDKISGMTMLVREMLENVLDAYATLNEKNARKVATMDLQVDEYYIMIRNEINEMVKKDPETFTANYSYIEVSKLLERIGDHIVNLAEWIVYSRSGQIVELNPGKSDPDLLHKLVNEKINSKKH